MNNQKKIVAQPPDSFSEAELQDFIALVRAGGEVNGTVLESNVRNAKCLVFLHQGDCLSGIAALKNPLLSYRKKIEKKSCEKIKAPEYPFELGYVFVLPSARRKGFSVELTSAALSAADGKGVFATTRVNNDGMQATLKKFGFAKGGSAYASGKGDHQLQLFLRPATPVKAA